MSNRLASETSPYLLQHAENPVDWFPWGEEALAQAKQEEKPIFLSIGYSACHWCHVMEHESFEDESIAAEMNSRFVCVKVDREERPDLDQIYMNAVQMMTGRGGWPMSVFLTPDLQPFFGGTYWPPKSRMGMPGFVEVLRAVEDAWLNRREAAIEQAGQLTERLKQISAGDGSPDELVADEQTLLSAFSKLEQMFDFTHGGFGGAPKFPHSMDLQVLLRIWRRSGRETALQMVQLNLNKMADGGIYDHLGGGFARYSVDERWLAPHFEKMLYDNALLTDCYIDAFLATNDANYERVAKETLDYILRDMTDEQGGFHSTEDADSEGEEGKYYVWTPDEIIEVLGADRGAQFCCVYDVSPTGNFEGKCILNLPRTIEQSAKLKQWDPTTLREQLREDRQKLLADREKRIRPGKDDKILASWNGLMIHTMARGAMVFDSQPYREAAIRAAEFVWNSMRRENGRLLHSWRHGQAKFDGYLEDYAYLANAFITLYEATFEERWIEASVELADQMLERFQDQQNGGFFFTADDHETLIARNKDLHDSSVPSSTAMAATSLFRLGRLTGRDTYLQAAESALQSAGDIVTRAPAAAGQLLIVLDMMLGPFRELVILGDPEDPSTEQLVRAARKRHSPNHVIACRSPTQETGCEALNRAFENRTTIDDQPTVYICEQFTCQAPLTGEAARDALAADP